MPTPIAYQKIRTSAGLVQIPLYAVADVTYSAFRVRTPAGIGCYDLIDPTAQTPLRIRTPLGIKGINTVVQAEGSSILNFTNPIMVGVGTVMDEDTPQYQLMHTTNNGNGVGYRFTAQVGNVVNASMDVDITQGVDDVISVRLWNVTQAKWITTNLKTGTITSGAHNLSGSITLTATHLVNGDQLELRVVQSWKNSVSDDFRFKVMKTSTLTIT
jgi:hypothetical protein